MSDRLILEISQVNTYIRELLDADEILGSLCVRGEISNYKRYPSGHHYFTLKDSEASLRCVMFRSSALRLRFRPENGMMVLAAGRITAYPRDGVYQLYCVSMMPDGAGSLSVAFEQLKKKLEAEGLFAEAHKKALPAFPKRIAVITSSAGAAVHDILRILGRRFPLTTAVIVPVRVQGEEAAGEIAAAIDYVNEYRLADLIITGRGGGSLEDLWAFNEEAVARAIYRSEIPVISAVGHEPDVAISDYAADLRAATPSNAAELAVPDQDELRGLLDQYQQRMTAQLLHRLQLSRAKLLRLAGSPLLASPLSGIQLKREQLARDQAALGRAAGRSVELGKGSLSGLQQRMVYAVKLSDAEERRRLSFLAGRLDAMSPLKVLARGYSIVTDRQDRIVMSGEQVRVGDQLSIRFHSGRAAARVEEILEDASQDG